ncbi:MAG: CopG family transcriptional regulator [Thermodesulfobacteriota bacterium]|nr:CopG family transcriptional regulator [Thermodesulfobacteriota bacterium]
MATLTKRSTVYFEPAIHNILKIKALQSSRSISDLVNEAVLHELAEDAEDLEAFEQRRSEPSISFEDLVKGLKADGKI